MPKTSHPEPVEKVNIAVASFDLDGTLVNTASEIAEAANLTLEHYNLERVPSQDVIMLVGHGAHALMRQLLKNVADSRPGALMPKDVDAVLATYDHYYAITTGTTGENYDGARETLDRLLEAGVRLACVTNKEERHAHRVLQVNGLHDAFELIIGGDSLAEKKPHPSVLMTVSESLGVPTQAMVHIGDSATDIQSARASGVLAVGVPYGYNAGKPIESANPDIICATLSGVADYIIDRRSRCLTQNAED